MRNERLIIRNCRSVILAVILVFALTATVFAQEIKFSGEAKSGIYWRQYQNEGEDPVNFVIMHNADDAGSVDDSKKTGTAGRFRLNIEYESAKGFGMKTRINWENLADLPQWSYGFGYGNFFNNQLTVSVGKLGSSPWGTGGPEMWKELEVTNINFGMRTEWKPAFLPGLNAGFVLNNFNGDMDQGWDVSKPLSLLNILQESVIGVSYTHDLFLVRLAYRFDDQVDAIQGNKYKVGDVEVSGQGEDEFIYRLEERVLKTYLPGFQIWAMGHLFGLSAENKDIQWFRNWLFIQYAPDLFTAQLRIGYDYINSRSDFYVKPSFYWNFFDKLLSVGLSFAYCQDFGTGKLYEGSPYRYIELEPKIQLNFDNNSYIAFAYNFRQEYLHPWAGLKPGKDPLRQTQWMNLRFCVYY
ncbi:hypothetical protein R84B8_03183 [Treponema sp. R8-4-B8]